MSCPAQVPADSGSAEAGPAPPRGTGRSSGPSKRACNQPASQKARGDGVKTILKLASSRGASGMSVRCGYTNARYLRIAYYVAVLGLAELKSVGAEVNRCALGGKAPGEERAAVHGVLEPRVEMVRRVRVTRDRRCLNSFGVLAVLGSETVKRQQNISCRRKMIMSYLRKVEMSY